MSRNAFFAHFEMGKKGITAEMAFRNGQKRHFGMLFRKWRIGRYGYFAKCSFGHFVMAKTAVREMAISPFRNGAEKHFRYTGQF
jgi:hypothetical protein